MDPIVKNFVPGPRVVQITLPDPDPLRRVHPARRVYQWPAEPYLKYKVLAFVPLLWTIIRFVHTLTLSSVLCFFVYTI